ncbi:MAG: carbohydrate kinase family protein [Patescibacteria group bacterium]|nr:carbohydrate kinase family protein [Patescibacteria group bacterium]
MFDVISIGDATIDTFLFVHDLQITEVGGTKKAMFNWGDKLPVDKLYRTVAGNAANNAVGSSRLGLKTAFYSVFANDSGGREIFHKMEKEKVSTRYIVKNDEHGTNASAVISFEGERTILVYHEHRKYELPNFLPAHWVYLTSMGKGFEKIYNSLVKYIDKYDVKLAFNPGTYQLLGGIKTNRVILKHTALLCLNLEEAESWVGKARSVEELCLRLSELGPEAVVITDGVKGAYSYSAEGFYFIEKFPGKRVEATGAGDSFATAYVAALCHGLPHSEALRWGPVNAASVVGQIGPQAGLLSRKEIEGRLVKNKTYRAVSVRGK